LRDEFGARLTVHTADILEFDPSAVFENDFVVVANLPYHVATAAVRHLLDAGPPGARRLVIMLQVEVAERITAQPGQLSALGVAIQVRANARLIRRVPRAAFYPRPNVDSAVLLVEPLPAADRVIASDELPAFVRLVQAGFKQPRKKLANSLAEGLQTDKALALELLEAADLDANRRPQELSVADWVRLFRST
jgi:16S rRNA (adenine1518-N6/adenine1519-N6)-dimethyltransferase